MNFNEKVMLYEMRQNLTVIKYIIVNGVMTIIYIVLYYILNDVFNINFTLANIVSYIFSVYIAYQLTKNFVFEVKKKSSRYIVFFIFTRMTMVIVNSGGHYLLVTKFGINQYISLIIMTVICFFLSYVINKKIFGD